MNLNNEADYGRFGLLGHKKKNKTYLYFIKLGTAVAQLLRCCATNRKVAGSIPAGVNGFFIDIKSFR